MQPTMVLAFILLGVVALVPVTYLAIAPDPVQVYLGPAQQAVLATPNHDPHRIQPAAPVAAEPLAVEPVATQAAAVRTVDPISSLALNSVALRAEPEPGTTSAPPLVAADTMLYAKEDARVRAAPSMTAEVLAKLDANAPLRATGRSTDGAWWRVPLGDGRIGYVHRAAVTPDRVAKAKPGAAPVPVVAAAPQRVVPTRRSPGFLGYVDQTVDWFVDTAAKGSPPTVVRPER